jgi:hypothetical protein
MRALVFRGAWDTAIETRRDPLPGPDDVLIKITEPRATRRRAGSGCPAAVRVRHLRSL